MIDLLDLINLVIYIKLDHLNSQNALKFTWIGVHHLILFHFNIQARRNKGGGWGGQSSQIFTKIDLSPTKRDSEKLKIVKNHKLLESLKVCYYL